jgi:hypothetical protein
MPGAPIDETFLLGLTITPGDPITGTVTGAGDGGVLAFCGWLQLMAIINDARGRPSAASGGLGAPLS